MLCKRFLSFFERAQRHIVVEHQRTVPDRARNLIEPEPHHIVRRREDDNDGAGAWWSVPWKHTAV